MIALDDALRLSGAPTIALVGAGGKTTTMFVLARRLAPSIVTTTTHLAGDEARFADHHLLWEQAAGALPPPAGVALVTGLVDPSTRRLQGLPPAAFSSLHAQVAGQRPLLVEADGSRRRPLKAPAAHEPAIPIEAQLVIVVAGLAGVGQPLDDRHVHRPAEFARLGGMTAGDRVTVEALVRVLAHREGGLRGIPAGARRVVLLNGADTDALAGVAASMAPPLLDCYDAVICGGRDRPVGIPMTEPVGAGVLAAHVHERWSVRWVHEPVAGVVLAAGTASRYGAPKQLLLRNGTPFVRVVAATAVRAGLEPVCVVVGAHASEVAAAVGDLPVLIVDNPRWERGQGTSVSAGVLSLPPRSGAAIFLMADQPDVPAALLRALVDAHALGLPPVVAPLVAGERSSPQLFDRVAFGDLAALEGEVGGRAILARYRVTEIPWPDASQLLDVDTPDDYRRLLDEA